jgi:hypothetical protein
MLNLNLKGVNIMGKKLSLHELLGEIKLLEKRIEKEISQVTFITIKKNSSKAVNYTYTEDEYNKKVISQYTSINDLIKLRDEYKHALMYKNSITDVKIGEVNYKIVDVIDHKYAIQFKEDLLEQMKKQYNEITRKSVSLDSEIKTGMDALINQMGGKEKKVSDETITSMTESYLNNMGYRIIDPIKLKEKMELLENEIDTFKTKVDTSLSNINSQTFVEIDDSGHIINLEETKEGELTV